LGRLGANICTGYEIMILTGRKRPIPHLDSSCLVHVLILVLSVVFLSVSTFFYNRWIPSERAAPQPWFSLRHDGG
jgi:hypothetical protein